MKLPYGKGMYIWRLARLGSPEYVAKTAKEIGLDWVCLKFQDGINVTDGSVVSDFENIKPDRYVQLLKEAGIKVHGWGYVYGGTKLRVDCEVNATIQAIERFKPDSWCIDAEKEYKDPITTEQLASRYVTNVRLRTPITVGYTSYRYPSYHETFHWDIFNRNCDYASPQVYWEQATNPRWQLEKSLAEYRGRTNIPLVPIGAAYPNGSWRPTAGQVDEFYQGVIDNGLPGWSWWEWYYAFLDKSIWNALIAHKTNIVEDNPEIPPVPKRKWWLYRLIEHVMR